MYRPALVALLSLGLAACEDSTFLTAPRTSAGAPSYAISDGAHNSGNAHFFFLPPMVPVPNFGGVFDAGVSPSVEICALATPNTCSTGPLVASYSKTAGSGGDLVTVDPVTEHYAVKWRTKDFNLSTTVIYRISVRVGTAQALGFADVQVVLNNQQAKNVDTGEFIPLVDDRVLLIQFRIEQGAVGPPKIGIDATALSVQTISLDGIGTFPTAAVQSLTLGAGTYKLRYDAGVSQPGVTFTVTAAGTVDYDPALNGVLDGRGTTTLRVNGRTIQLDATSLSVPVIEIAGILGGPTAFSPSVVKTLTLLPAEHRVLYNAGVSQPSVNFMVTTAGTVDYDPALNGVLDGRGTTTLRVNGRTIQLDATPLSVPLFEVSGVFGGVTALPASVVKTMTLLPAEHRVFYNAGVSQPGATFAVTTTGTIDYAPVLDDILAGRGTTTLRLNGRTIQVDATALGVPLFELFGNGAFPASSIQPLTLMPAEHEIRAGTSDFRFAITADGTLAYDTVLYPFLTGAGTTLLTILALP